MLRRFHGEAPVVPASAWVDPSAQVIGRVTLGERASIWCNAVVRGDGESITIGDDTNIQDLSCLHVTTGIAPLVIGARVTVGHHVVLHGCTIEDECLIGIGAIVLDGAVIGRGSVLAAGAMVTPRTVIPPGSFVVGSPATVKRPCGEREAAMIELSWAAYVEELKQYRAEEAQP